MFFHEIEIARNTKFQLKSSITLRKLIGFAQNRSHSIAFVSLYKYISKTCIFRWNIKFYIEKTFFSWLSHIISSKSDKFSQNSSNMRNRIFWLRLSFIVEIQKFWLKTIVFSRNRNRPEHEILDKRVNNSSKSHRIRSKQVSFDSIRLTRQVNIKKCIFLGKIISYSISIFHFRASHLRNNIFWLWSMVIIWNSRYPFENIFIL